MLTILLINMVLRCYNNIITHNILLIVILQQATSVVDYLYLLMNDDAIHAIITSSRHRRHVCYCCYSRRGADDAGGRCSNRYTAAPIDCMSSISSVVLYA